MGILLRISRKQERPDCYTGVGALFLQCADSWLARLMYGDFSQENEKSERKEFTSISPFKSKQCLHALSSWFFYLHLSSVILLIMLLSSSLSSFLNVYFYLCVFMPHVWVPKEAVRRLHILQSWKGSQLLSCELLSGSIGNLTWVLWKSKQQVLLKAEPLLHLLRVSFPCYTPHCQHFNSVYLPFKASEIIHHFFFKF